MRIEQVIQKDQIGDEIHQQVILYKGDVFTYFDSGLTRHVFVNHNKTKAIKILQKSVFKDFNTEEFEIYQNASPENKSQMAATQLTYNGHVIEQEFCNPIKFDDRPLTIPQMLFAASCRNEVGFNAQGNLVCFDLDEYKKY